MLYNRRVLEAAIEYSKNGFSVIPVGTDKRPLLSQWRGWQIERADEAQIREWWTNHPFANVAIITGEISGLVVLDCDSEEGFNKIQELGMPETVVVKTGKEWGRHYYFQRPESEEPIRNFAKKVPGLDFRGDGGYVLAPPSVHSSGVEYQWITGGEECLK